MKDREYWIKWSKAAGIRAVKTIAETAISFNRSRYGKISYLLTG